MANFSSTCASLEIIRSSIVVSGPFPGGSVQVNAGGSDTPNMGGSLQVNMGGSVQVNAGGSLQVNAGGSDGATNDILVGEASAGAFFPSLWPNKPPRRSGGLSRSSTYSRKVSWAEA